MQKSPKATDHRHCFKAPSFASAVVTRLRIALLAFAVIGGIAPVPPFAVSSALAASPTYEVKFRVKGIVSTTTVQARDAGQAKKLVMAQYGGEAQVLSVKRLN